MRVARPLLVLFALAIAVGGMRTAARDARPDGGRAGTILWHRQCGLRRRAGGYANPAAPSPYQPAPAYAAAPTYAPQAMPPYGMATTPTYAAVTGQTYSAPAYATPAYRAPAADDLQRLSCNRQ